MLGQTHPQEHGDSLNRHRLVCLVLVTHFESRSSPGQAGGLSHIVGLLVTLIA